MTESRGQTLPARSTGLTIICHRQALKPRYDGDDRPDDAKPGAMLQSPATPAAMVRPRLPRWQGEVEMSNNFSARNASGMSPSDWHPTAQPVDWRHAISKFPGGEAGPDLQALGHRQASNTTP